MPELGISNFELMKLLPGLRKRLKKALPYGNLDVVEGLSTVAWLCNKFSRAADSQYEEMFRTLGGTFQSMTAVLAKEEKMAKIELGITVGEIMGMLPGILSNVWESYSDDKKITVDEALELIGVILREMAEAADDDAVADFLVAQAEAFEALSPLLADAAEEPVE